MKLSEFLTLKQTWLVRLKCKYATCCEFRRTNGRILPQKIIACLESQRCNNELQGSRHDLSGNSNFLHLLGKDFCKWYLFGVQGLTNFRPRRMHGFFHRPCLRRMQYSEAMRVLQRLRQPIGWTFLSGGSHSGTSPDFRPGIARHSQSIHVTKSIVFLA